jgi:MFS family permease
MIAPSQSAPAWYSSVRCAACLLCVLLLINTFNYLDRSLIGTLADPIGRELRISDTQFGIIGGVAFMLVYTLAALYLARWVDRGHPKRVVLGSVALWSVMTCLCACATGFLSLAVTRVGMALGEAGLIPAAQALLTQRFSSERLGTVLAILWVGTSLGDALAPAVAGLLNDAVGWRTTFLILGPLALLILPLAALVIRRDSTSSTRGESRVTVPSTRAAIAKLWSIPAYRAFWLGAALALVGPSAYGFYVVPFLMRAHRMSSGLVGEWLGPALIVAGIAGPPLGGLLFDRLNRIDFKAGLLVPAIMPLLSGVFALFAWNASNWHAAVCFYALAVFSHMLIVGPMYATVQRITPPPIRGISVAFFNMGMTLLGGIFGPLLAGFLSDLGSTRFGNRSLGPALSCMALFQLSAGIAFAGAAASFGAERSRSA